MNSDRRRMIIAACACIMLGAGTHAAAQATDPNSVVEAVWKTQSMEFEYRSDSVYYNCEALRYKLQRILTSIGAHPNIELRSLTCIDDIGVARFHVTLHSPVPATEDNVRELTTYTVEQELAARVRGEQLYSADELPRFVAVWRTVSFARDRRMRLAAADCELVEQLRRQVLPKLSVQIVTDIRCSMMARDLSAPRLTVSALTAVPDPLGRAR